MTESSDRPAYRPFRPRAARLVSWVLGAIVLVVMIVIAVALPAMMARPVAVGDQVAIIAFGVAVAWFLSRQAGVRAIPDPEGLTVRNLVVTTRLGWNEIVSVRFGPDRPWVQVDLSDGRTLAVMAVQRADGDAASAEARRLATLVAQHSITERDD